MPPARPPEQATAPRVRQRPAGPGDGGDRGDRGGRLAGQRGARRRLWPLLCALLLAMVPVLAACSDEGDGAGGVEQPSGKTGFVSGSGAVTKVPEAKRKPAPELAGDTLGGEKVSLSDYRGKVVVLNIWGSWCPPCRKEAPELAAASEKLADSDVQFLGIDTRDNHPVQGRQFVQEYGIEYPNIYDPDGSLLLGFRGTVPPSAIPSTLVIDRQGRVAARILGESTKKTFVQLARDVAGEEKQASDG